MPTTLKRLGAFFTEKEARQLKEKADSIGLTVSGYLRSLAGLKPLERGKRKKGKSNV